MSDIEFPMYFSLVPDPGYDRSVLDKFGIDGEFQLFYGYYANGVEIILSKVMLAYLMELSAIVKP